MKKTLITALFATGFALAANAQDQKAVIEVPQWVKDVKLSGYGMVQYQGNDKKNNEENSFNLRLVRFSAEARPHKDFYAKAQMQVNGNTSEGASAIRLVDLFGEWQKYKYFMVKAGQFKRPFTFENPMHPITQGFMSYSQNVSKLAGFSDRTGEQASNGRDIGLQLQGDLLPIGGRPWLHYQVGVFNGQGINVKDVDNRKDIIGGLWLMPVSGLLRFLSRVRQGRLDVPLGVHPLAGIRRGPRQGRQGRRYLRLGHRACHQEKDARKGSLRPVSRRSHMGLLKDILRSGRRLCLHQEPTAKPGVRPRERARHARQLQPGRR